MKSLNSDEISKFCFDCCQAGGTATGVKAFVNGELINIAYHNSVTGEALAIQWDYAEELKQRALQ